MSNLITPGDLAPDFELEDVQGNRVRLSDFRGKPVILAFLRGFQ
jgi:peroxiredoxin